MAGEMFDRELEVREDVQVYVGQDAEKLKFGGV